MKRILSILLCTVLLCGLMPHTVFAAGEVLSLTSNEHGDISVRLSAPASMLIAAAYQNDKVIDCEMKNNCPTGVYGFSLPAGFRYKIFAWDSSFAPLCEALDIPEVLSLSSNEHGNIVVKLTAPAPMLIAVAYQNGKVIDCELKNKCSPGVYNFSLTESYRYKVFAWDNSLTPLCKALEITDDSSVVLREETNVSIPTLDDSVASALGAAVSDYASVSLALQKIQETFADEDAFAEIENNHELYRQYSRMLSETIDSLQGSTTSMAALDAVAKNQINKIHKKVKLMSDTRISLQSKDEVISWAEELSSQFDALEGNNRIQQMAKNMGCDVKTAYAALTAAQDVLYKRYTADANCYENWEKAMIAIKATSKVGFYVCAVAATAGAATVAAVPAALTTGTVTAGGAAGLMVGAADVGIELSVDSAKIIIGGNAKGDKIIQDTEDKLKPVTDGLLLYSLCTLNTANGAEKLAFLGDIGQRGKEIYDSITLKSDEKGNLKADIVSLDNSNPSAFEVAKEKELPSGEDVLEASADTAVERINNEYGKSKKELMQLLEEEDIVETDKDFNKLIIDFNNEAVEEVNNPNPDPNPPPNPHPPRFERLVEYYDPDTGELTGVYCYDSRERLSWKKYYTQGKVSSFAIEEWDENGDRIETSTRYVQDSVTGFYTTQIDWIRKSKYIGGSYTNEILLEEIEYNDNGTIGEVYKKFENYSNRKVYDENGLISMDVTRYPDRTHEYSYYTSNDPNVPGVDRIGHLQYEHEYHEEFISEYVSLPVYTIKKEWTAVKRSNYVDKCYEYGWNYSVWNGSYMESGFQLVSTSPMPEK